MPSNSCPLSPISSSGLNLSQHQSLFQWISSSHKVANVLGLLSASVLPMNIQGWFPLGLTGMISLLSRDSQESSPASQFESIDSLVLRLLYGPNLTSVHDYWKNHSLDYMDLCQQSDVSAFKYVMASNMIHSDFGAQEKKICHCFHFFHFYLPWSDRTRCHDPSFLNVEFQVAF